MTVSKSHAYFTPEDYLEIERISPIKHEYLQEQMVAMAGASKAHVIVTGNLSALLVNHLRGTGCISYATDMKVRLPTLNLFCYRFSGYLRGARSSLRRRLYPASQADHRSVVQFNGSLRSRR